MGNDGRARATYPHPIRASLMPCGGVSPLRCWGSCMPWEPHSCTGVNTPEKAGHVTDSNYGGPKVSHPGDRLRPVGTGRDEPHQAEFQLRQRPSGARPYRDTGTCGRRSGYPDRQPPRELALHGQTQFATAALEPANAWSTWSALIPISLIAHSGSGRKKSSSLPKRLLPWIHTLPRLISSRGAVSTAHS
jgi:hypothetical protein